MQALQGAEAEAAELRRELAAGSVRDGEVRAARAARSAATAARAAVTTHARARHRALRSLRASRRAESPCARSSPRAQLSALRAQLATSRLHAVRLSAERDKLLEISNRLRADLNRLADQAAEDDGALPVLLRATAAAVRVEGVGGTARARDRAGRAGHAAAFGPATVSYAAPDDEPLAEFEPLRAREPAEASHSGMVAELLEIEQLEGVRASAASNSSLHRGADGGGTARAHASNARIALAGSAWQPAGRAGSGSASERETASQQSARERERQRQRAEAARKRSLVPNYNRLSEGN